MESPTSEPTLATCDGHNVLFAAGLDPHLLFAVAGSYPPCRHALDASLGPQGHVLLRALVSSEEFWRAGWTRYVRVSRVPEPGLSSAAAAAGELCTSTFEYRSSTMARPYPMETLPRMHACQDAHGQRQGSAASPPALEIFNACVCVHTAHACRARQSVEAEEESCYQCVDEVFPTTVIAESPAYPPCPSRA